MRLLICSCLWLCLAQVGYAQLGDALVIANGDYGSLQLQSPLRDAERVAARFNAIGLNTRSVVDGNLAEMRQAVVEYVRRLPTNSTAVVYVAGLTVPGEWKGPNGLRVRANYLIPHDAEISKDSEVRSRGLALPEIMRELTENSGCRDVVVLLDVARGDRMRPMDSPDASTRLEPALKWNDSLVCFSASPADNAEAGDQPSAFAAALVESLATADARMVEVGKSLARKFWAVSTLRERQRAPLEPQQRVTDVEPARPGQMLVNSIGQVYCWCPPGEFAMGSKESESQRSYDEQQVRVRLTKGFWISRYEVTEREYRLATRRSPKNRLGKNFPLVDTRSGDAKRFADNLTKLERASGRLPSGWAYRLPTEAEWEYACRAGTTTAYSFGDKPADLTRYGNFADRSLLNENPSDFRYAHPVWDDGSVRAAAVGSYLPNAWGVHDMHGNVWEWCADAYQPQLSGGDDPAGPKKGTDRGRVIRGGSWLSYAHYCRSAMRQAHHDLNSTPYIGLRVVLKRVED